MSEIKCVHNCWECGCDQCKELCFNCEENPCACNLCEICRKELEDHAHSKCNSCRTFTIYKDGKYFTCTFTGDII